LSFDRAAATLHLMNARQRPLLFGAAALVAVWLLAIGGYALADHWKMTAEKLRAFLAQRDLNALSGEARAKALQDLEDKINALSPEERRNARLGKLWSKWFEEMTEAEKSAFLEATLPTGFKQMLTSFEQLAPEKRKQAIDGAIKNLKDARDSSPEEYQKANASRTNGPVLSEDLQKQVAVIGLKSVYSDSSAETKAELAPLLEEVQKNMESGRMFRGGH
jgi:hypothetical protein